MFRVTSRWTPCGVTSAMRSYSRTTLAPGCFEIISTSAFDRTTDSSRTFRHVRKVQILLQKSFWGVERKFLEPLMRFTRGDVRDHIASSKIDHGPSWRL